MIVCLRDVLAEYKSTLFICTLYKASVPSVINDCEGENTEGAIVEAPREWRMGRGFPANYGIGSIVNSPAEIFLDREGKGMLSMKLPV